MNNQQATVTSSDNSAVIASQMPADDAGTQAKSDVIETRFGKITVNRENPIAFQKGLLGMPEKTSFALMDFPVEKFAQFKLLQSLEDNNLSFIALPIDIENAIIDRKDIEDGCKDLGFSEKDVALLLVVSVHRDIDQVRLSANARAPIFMDAKSRKAEQYVLRNNKYVVRHMISA